MKKRVASVIVILSAAAITFYLVSFREPGFIDYYQKYMKGRKTVGDIMNQHEAAVVERLKENFEKIKIKYPPDKITLVCLKSEKILELWIETGETAILLKKYEIFGASGGAGPKLIEGDCQVPEGIYKIEGLNPNSHFHLSMKVNYPNEFDRKKAIDDGRSNPGGDIFIHGNKMSVGCIAIGDRAIEEVFVLSARAIKNGIKVIIMPYDMRKDDGAASKKPAVKARPLWISELYSNIGNEIVKYK